MRAVDVDIFVVVDGSVETLEGVGNRLSGIVGTGNAKQRILNNAESSVHDKISREICLGKLANKNYNDDNDNN